MAALRAVLAIAAKDILTWFRTPSAIVASLLPPLAFLLIIFVVAGAVGRNPIALVVEDSGPQSQRLVSILEDSDAFRVQRATPVEATHLLDTLQVAAVITVPASFDDDYQAHRSDPVSVQINNLNLDFTNDLRRSVPAAITGFYADQPDTPIMVGVAESDLRPHDVDLVQFELVPILVLLLTIMGIVNGGLAAAREFEDLTIKALLLSPIGRGTLIAGKILSCWVTTMLVAAVVLVLSFAFGVLRPAGWYWLPALAAIGLIALAAAGLGTALGGALRRFSAVAGVGINLSIYLFFLSGGISVAAFLPDWIQNIAHFTPTFYGVDALEEAIFYRVHGQSGAGRCGSRSDGGGWVGLGDCEPSTAAGRGLGIRADLLSAIEKGSSTKPKNHTLSKTPRRRGRHRQSPLPAPRRQQRTRTDFPPHHRQRGLRRAGPRRPPRTGCPGRDPRGRNRRCPRLPCVKVWLRKHPDHQPRMTAIHREHLAAVENRRPGARTRPSLNYRHGRARCRHLLLHRPYGRQLARGPATCALVGRSSRKPPLP